MNAEPTDAPRLSAWQDAHDRLVVGEANETGAWIAAPRRPPWTSTRCGSMVDPSLPPGTTHADIDRHYGPPETVHILGSVLLGVDAETHTPANTDDLERALADEVDQDHVFEAEIGDTYTQGDTVHVAGGVWVAADVEVPDYTSKRERKQALMESIDTTHDVVEARIGEVER